MDFRISINGVESFGGCSLVLMMMKMRHVQIWIWDISYHVWRGMQWIPFWRYSDYLREIASGLEEGNHKLVDWKIFILVNFLYFSNQVRTRTHYWIWKLKKFLKTYQVLQVISEFVKTFVPKFMNFFSQNFVEYFYVK